MANDFFTRRPRLLTSGVSCFLGGMSASSRGNRRRRRRIRPGIPAAQWAQKVGQKEPPIDTSPRSTPVFFATAPFPRRAFIYLFRCGFSMRREIRGSGRDVERFRKTISSASLLNKSRFKENGSMPTRTRRSFSKVAH